MKNSWTGGEAAGQSSAPPEENLAVAVHRCEPGAFERLIERFERPLFTYAHGILQNAVEAQLSGAAAGDLRRRPPRSVHPHAGLGTGAEGGGRAAGAGDVAPPGRR